MYISEQTKLIWFNTTQFYFSSVGYLDMHATCFGMYLSHRQAWQYEKLIEEDTRRILILSSLVSFLYWHAWEWPNNMPKHVACILTKWNKTSLCCVKLNKRSLLSDRKLTWILSGLGCLEVAYRPLVPKFAGSNPAEAVGFFRAKKKILSTPYFGREVKPLVPFRIFAACKRTRKCMRGSRSFRSKLPAISRPSSSSFHY